MKKIEMAQTFLSKRKMLLLLPLLIIPFLTMGFWALGGGKGAGNGKKDSGTGLNPVLTDARLKEETTSSKLSLYDQRARYSVRLMKRMSSNPFYTLQLKSETLKSGKG